MICCRSYLFEHSKIDHDPFYTKFQHFQLLTKSFPAFHRITLIINFCVQKVFRQFLKAKFKQKYRYLRCRQKREICFSEATFLKCAEAISISKQELQILQMYIYMINKSTQSPHYPVNRCLFWIFVIYMLNELRSFP